MANKEKADLTFLRDVNKAKVLKIVREYKQASRSKIFKITNLGWATVTKFVKELIDEGLILEVGKEGGSRGRKTVLLEVNPEAGYFIGVDLGTKNFTSAITDFEGKVISRLRNITRPDAGYEEVIKLITNSISILINDSKVDTGMIKGVGVALPGLIDFRTGTVIESPNMKEWNNVPIKAILENKLKMPVYVDRNARTMMIAERWFGGARGVENLIYINVGEGVSAAFVFNGRMFRGESSSVGELGHTFIMDSDIECGCGKKGCLETFIAAPYIARKAVGLIKKGENSSITGMVKGVLENVTSEIVATAAKNGDELSIQLFKDVGKYLGLAVSNLVNLLNPDMVVIGGGVSKSGRLLMEPLKETVDKRTMEVPKKSVSIVPENVFEDAGVIGAAGLVLHELYEPPTIDKLKEDF